MDNAIEFIKGSKTATVTFSQGKYINKILSLAETHPEVEILERPESNDGYLYARIPVSWVKVSPPRNSNMSDEMKEQFADRMRQRRRNEQK